MVYHSSQARCSEYNRHRKLQFYTYVHNHKAGITHIPGAKQDTLDLALGTEMFHSVNLSQR